MEFLPVSNEALRVSMSNNKTTRFSVTFFLYLAFETKKKNNRHVVNNFVVDAINNFLFVFC